MDKLKQCSSLGCFWYQTPDSDKCVACINKYCSLCMTHSDVVPCSKCLEKFSFKIDTRIFWVAPPNNCRIKNCFNTTKNKDNLFCEKHHEELKEEFTIKF